MFTWDSAKAALNIEKHDVSFEEAATVFGDPNALDWADVTHSHAERRNKRLGRSGLGRILLVIYTIRRLRDDKETIRIISSRHASRKERKAYVG